MSRLKHNVSNNRTYALLIALSTLIPISVMTLIYAMKGIYPEGPNTILIMDLQAQYMPFYASLRYIFNSDNSVLFSMLGGLGTNNFGNFAYYLTSPLAWVTSLFSLKQLPDCIYFIVLIKLGACGASFCGYMLYTYRENRHKLAIVLLSSCYALMSYNIAYSLNIMWIDGVIMLPLILIGIERVVSDEKVGILVCAVAVSLILDYYISYMTAVFCFFYLIIRITELDAWKLRKIWLVARGALLGVGLAMPIVLPGICAMRSGKAVEGKYTVRELFRYSFVEVLGQLVSGRYDSVYDDGLPFIFCGTCTLVLVVFFLVMGKQNAKTKIMYSITMIFYLIAMCFVPLDRLMHGFRETTCFEVRYGYVFSCFMLIMAYKGVDVLVELVKKYKLGNWVRIVASVFVIIELYMNASIVISNLMVETHYKTRREYDLNLDVKSELLNVITDNSVYRVSDTSSFTHNEGAWLGYNGFGYFSSCYNLGLMDYLGDLGEDQIYHDLIDKRRTRLEEVLLGAKYRLEYIPRDDKEHVLASKGPYRLVENDDALSIGYMTFYDGNEEPISKNAFENQNNLAKELSGLDESVFVEIKPDVFEDIQEEDYAKHIKMKLTVETEAPLWIYFEWASYADRKEKDVYISDENNPHFNGGIQDIRLFVDGEDYGKFLDDNSSFMIYLGRHSKGDTIEIEALSMVYFGDIHVDYMDENVYNMVVERLKDHQYQISKYKDGYFEGTINAGEGGEMFLSLPYIEGWKAYVDGERVEISSYRNVFLIIPLEAGTHDVELRFLPPGIITGMIIGLVALCAFIHWIKGPKFQNNIYYGGDKGDKEIKEM